MSDDPSGETSKLGPMIYLATIAGVLATWAIIGLMPMAFFCAWETRGTFGDMFGAANALFGALGTAGIVIALILQNRQIQQQIHDGRAAARELQDQKTTQAAIVDALARQARALDRAARISAATALVAELERLESQTSNPLKRSELSRRAEELRRELATFLEAGLKE